jgi:hypothetical protein
MGNVFSASFPLCLHPCRSGLPAANAALFAAGRPLLRAIEGLQRGSRVIEELS